MKPEWAIPGLALLVVFSVLLPFSGRAGRFLAKSNRDFYDVVAPSAGGSDRANRSTATTPRLLCCFFIVAGVGFLIASVVSA